MPAAPVTNDSPVFLPANFIGVTATALITWTPAAALAGGGARVSLATGTMLACFGTRLKISRLAADLAVARAIHLLNLRLSGAAWSRILGELKEYKECRVKLSARA